MRRSSTRNHIEINLSSRLLFLVKNKTVLKTYRVAIGKESTPTPTGMFKVVNKKIMTHPSVFGSRWIGIDDTGYGIHGTNNPDLIGKAVSNGCIRMYNSDVEEVFSAISIGSMVKIYFKKPGEGLAYPTSNSSLKTKPYYTSSGEILPSISERLNISLHHL